jgi:hypothetical protein
MNFGALVSSLSNMEESMQPVPREVAHSMMDFVEGIKRFNSLGLGS